MNIKSVKIDLHNFIPCLFPGFLERDPEVWNEGGNNNFKGIWHLKESGDGTANEYKDSTSNANHGQDGAGDSSKTPTQTTAGKIGNVEEFDWSDDYINVASGASLVITNALTFAAWVYADRNDNFILGNPTSNSNFGSYALATTGGNIQFVLNNGVETTELTFCGFSFGLQGPIQFFIKSIKGHFMVS